MTLNAEIIRATIAELKREQVLPHSANRWMYIKVLNDCEAALSTLLYHDDLADGYAEGRPDLHVDESDEMLDLSYVPTFPTFECVALRGSKRRRSAAAEDGDAL